MRSSARQVLDELADILNVLRTGDRAGNRTGADPTTDPAPTLRQIPALVDSFQQTGLRVVLETAGGRRAISDATAIAVYRTVQEALTNAHKYGSGSAHVRLLHRAEGLELVVTNPIAPGGDRTSSGFGLLGMRERVHAAGGRLSTGPRPDGTFVVDALFPHARSQEEAS